jgi:hypothetical protein
MRHGWLWLISLFCSLALLSFTAQAQQLLSIQQRDLWLAKPELDEKVDELFQLIENNDIDALQSQLQGLAFPQQEAIRYLLLLRCQQSNTVFSPQMEQFVAQQRLLAPQFQVVEKGSGFEFYAPAFDYPALANLLLKSSRLQRDSSALLSAIEQHLLELKLWLSGDTDQIEQHQVLLLRVLPSLTSEQVRFLAEQIKQDGVVSWLPANQVIVELAKRSQDAELYKLLWLKRANLYSEQEVIRLAAVADPAAIQHLLLASNNPRLTPLVQSELSKIFPMPDEVRQFFIQQLQQKDQVSFVAQLLIEQGYRHWLEELANSNSGVQRKLLRAELAK